MTVFALSFTYQCLSDNVMAAGRARSARVWVRGTLGRLEYGIERDDTEQWSTPDHLSIASFPFSHSHFSLQYLPNVIPGCDSPKEAKLAGCTYDNTERNFLCYNFALKISTVDLRNATTLLNIPVCTHQVILLTRICYERGSVSSSKSVSKVGFTYILCYLKFHIVEIHRIINCQKTLTSKSIYLAPQRGPQNNTYIHSVPTRYTEVQEFHFFLDEPSYYGKFYALFESWGAAVLEIVIETKVLCTTPLLRCGWVGQVHREVERVRSWSARVYILFIYLLSLFYPGLCGHAYMHN